MTAAGPSWVVRHGSGHSLWPSISDGEGAVPVGCPGFDDHVRTSPPCAVPRDRCERARHFPPLFLFPEYRVEKGKVQKHEYHIQFLISESTTIN